MKKIRFVRPYLPTGKTRFPERNKSGVYLISENSKVVYVGFSESDLYKTMYRHFQVWNHTGQFVVSYADFLKTKEYKVRIVYCTAKQAAELEKALILKHRPRDNWNKYSELSSQEKIKKRLRLVMEKYNELEAESAPF